MSQIKWNFTNKKAIVTGGSRGIGREIVKMLAYAGANVLFTYSKNKESAESLVKELNQYHVVPIQCDFSSQEDINILINIINTLGFDKLDYLVNNVGTTKDTYLHKMTQNEWDSVLQVNLSATFQLTKALTLPLIYNKGSIVNITSVTGIAGMAGQANYAASKAGLIGLTKSLAKEVGRFGLRVNALAPGYIETDMTTNIDEAEKKVVRDSISLRRMGTTKEIANTALFLLSEDSSYTTGQVFIVDGGLI
ncbi:3-oxoacyl-ACP reductase FabG [Cytobacillus praedii]|uniref:3-oxoacyl-ACP reductase FabG n=1 Tax=Cytobacillus praedii TaxID=1742358 RepID=UPI003F7E07BA